MFDGCGLMMRGRWPYKRCPAQSPQVLAIRVEIGFVSSPESSKRRGPTTYVRWGGAQRELIIESLDTILP